MAEQQGLDAVERDRSSVYHSVSYEDMNLLYPSNNPEPSLADTMGTA